MKRLSRSGGNNSQDTPSLMGDVAIGQKGRCTLKAHILGTVRSFIFALGLKSK